VTGSVGVVLQTKERSMTNRSDAQDKKDLAKVDFYKALTLLVTTLTSLTKQYAERKLA
jgi:hypothetical protein